MTADKYTDTLNNFSNLSTNTIMQAVKQHGTPFYMYDEELIIKKCRELLAMPNAYGLKVRYAMKANSNRTILGIINEQGLLFDASSMNEARRAHMAGIDYKNIILTTQEVPYGDDSKDLEDMIKQGLKYNACSLQQLYQIGDFASENNVKLAIRIHPGVGSGETATRNTGDNYSCFGIHLSDVLKALEYAEIKSIIFDHVHVHIGSGADPDIWRSNIDLEMDILEKYFPYAETISFGGGLKEARMPDETSADIQELGKYAKMRLIQFYEKTGRKLNMEIEPGTYVTANSGYAVTSVIDKKKTGNDGFNFILVNGGMEINARPLLYASRHPFYIVSQKGGLLSSEFDESSYIDGYEAVIVGRCCESGDSQCLNNEGLSIPRRMSEPNIGDFVVIGGTGAYCSSMAPMNYNSHVQAAELLFLNDGSLKEIRKRQTLDQIVENEI